MQVVAIFVSFALLSAVQAHDADGVVLAESSAVKATELLYNPFAPAPTPPPAPAVAAGASTAEVEAAQRAAQEKYADAEAKKALARPASLSNAMSAFQADLWRLITIRSGYQWVTAVIGLVFGLVAVFDGNECFKGLVLIAIVGVNFCFVLSQVNATWVGPIAMYAKYVASLEFGLFVGYAARKGWEGTQLVLGLVIGIYLYQIVQGIALTVPHVQEAAVHPAWKVVVGTLAVLLGAWGVNEKLGAGRFFGVVAPLFGSSVVSASLSYLLMMSCILPGGLAKTTFHVTVTKADIPSVFEFWYMIAYPMHSRAVGIFNFAHKSLVIGGKSYEIDRILAIVFWFVFFYFGMRFQLRRDADRRSREADSKTLLEKIAAV